MQYGLKYIIWRTIFRLTPARWIVAGCNGWHTLRGRIGEWITRKFAGA
jgi:hypothetical protein